MNASKGLFPRTSRRSGKACFPQPLAELVTGNPRIPSVLVASESYPQAFLTLSVGHGEEGKSQKEAKEMPERKVTGFQLFSL